jgi:hypothetical protein
MNSTFNYIINKYNITVGRQYFIDIPQMIGSVSLAQLFAELNFTMGVEIGTDQGEFAEVLLKANPKLDLFCVDPWKAEAYDKGEQPESGEDQTFFNKRYEDTQKRLKEYDSIKLMPPRAHIYRMTSLQALYYFPDNSVDFVYIDGNHDFLNVTQDMHYWLKKVRPGGILSGHDYVRYPSSKFNHVKRVVQAYAPSYHLLPVFAVMQDQKGLRRDRFRSWFLVKP